MGVYLFLRRDSKVSLEIQSVAIMRWSSEEIAFAVKAYISNGPSVIETHRVFLNRFNVARETLFLTGNQFLHGSLRSGKVGIRHDEELEYLSPLDHMRTLRQ